MAVFLLTSGNDPEHHTHDALQHHSPLHIEERLSDDLAQEYQENICLSHGPNQHQSDSAHFIGGLQCTYNSEKEVPPRPDSRMDFVLGSPSTLSSNTLDEIEPKAQFRSHKRTPSATLRWTREFLKKIRLTGSTFTQSSGSDSPPCSNTPTVDAVAAALSTCNGTIIDECMMITGGVSSSPEFNSSISNSSSLSTSSSGSHPALDNIYISLSSSSDFDGSSDGDSDSDLDSLKEIDLGDVLAGEARNIEYVVPVKGVLTYEPSHVPTYSPVPASPLNAQSSISSTYPANSHTESILETFPTDNGDPDQSMLEYVPEPRTKYTCLPSPLSLFPPVNPTTLSQSQFASDLSFRSAFQPQRHIYADRGHSRHALHYRKWFWALREEDWARYTEWLEECQSQQEAYTGMSTSPVFLHESQSGEEDGKCVVQGSQSESGFVPIVQGWQPEPKEEDQVKLFPSLFSSARESVPNNCRQRTESSGNVREDLAASNLPPLTIHPRWGDLLKLNLATDYNSATACTETWCMHTDRYLLVGMGLGLWTIRKVLWLFELNRICGIHDSRGEDKEEGEEGDKTFVANGESKDFDAASGSENCLTSDDSQSLFEEDDFEEGEIMYSSVVSLTSLISTTTSSEDSDITLVESDSDAESPTNNSSLSALIEHAESHRSGRSIDFNRTCSCDPLVDNEGGFEEIDLGSGSGSSSACGSILSGSTNIEAGNCSPETESLALLRSLFLAKPIVPSLTAMNEYVTMNAKGKYGTDQQLPRWDTSYAKRNWNEQCELLLELTGARETLVYI